MNSKPILFIDFDGTICFDRYWRSLPPVEYEKIQELFFKGENVLLGEWMRGKHSAEEMNKYAAEHIGWQYEKLWDLFVKDCSTMQVSRTVLEKINALRKKYTVILVTTNMDSFSRFTAPALQLEKYFDAISNSFNEGKYKTDKNGEIYLEYAKKYDVDMKDSVVIDDSPKVCSIFESLGGTSHHITAERSIEYYLDLLLK